MKYRILSILGMSALICTAAGCSGSSSSESGSSAPQTTQASQATQTAGTTAAAMTESAEEGTKSSEKFDFGKAVKSITICGKEISYPITLADLGDDFTLNLDSDVTSTSYFEDYMVTVNYKGKYVGVVTYNDIDSPDKISKDTYMAGIRLTSSNADSFDVPLITVNGIGLGDKRERVTAEFGISKLDMDNRDMYWEVTEKERSLSFEYASPDNDTIEAIDIIWN